MNLSFLVRVVDARLELWEVSGTVAWETSERLGVRSEGAGQAGPAAELPPELREASPSARSRAPLTFLFPNAD